MRINTNYAYRPTFQSSDINILANADNHGCIYRLPSVFESVDNNIGNIFANADKKSTLNILALAGDWFINPSNDNFATPNVTNGSLQKWALFETIENIKSSIFNKFHNSNKINFETVYTMGNHCLDGGTDFIMDVMKTIPMTSLITNVNLELSPKVVEAMEKSDNIVKSVVFDVQDDKQEDLQHKLLVLGVTIPSMKGICEGLKFYDDCEKKDTDYTPDMLAGTINSVKEQVEKFKEENPNGAVILLSHMGENLAKFVINDVPEIDLVLSGHDHKTSVSKVGKTILCSLGKDNEILKSIQCKFDDNGNFTVMTPKQYDIDKHLSDKAEKHPFNLEMNEKLAYDVLPLIVMKDLTDNPVNELYYGNEIRYQNSYLMNFLTSAIKEQIINEFDSDVDIVGIPSSVIRCGLENNQNNIKLMKLFDGVSKELAGLQSGYVNGQDLIDLVVENVIYNLMMPTRNTLIHWSDIQVNRSMIENIKSGKINSNYSDAVFIRNPQTDKFEPVDLNKKYKMVLGSKFLDKNTLKMPPKIRPNFHKINCTYQHVFRRYLQDNYFEIVLTPKAKEKRVL